MGRSANSWLTNPEVMAGHQLCGETAKTPAPDSDDRRRHRAWRVASGTWQREARPRNRGADGDHHSGRLAHIDRPESTGAADFGSSLREIRKASSRADALAVQPQPAASQ